jgi:acetyl esterase/lipase
MIHIESLEQLLRRLSVVTGPAPVGFRYGASPEQVGELWLPERGARCPLAILVHGGYWRARYGLDVMHAMAGDLRARGVVVWNVEYRRVGSPGGGWPGTFEDVAAAVDAPLSLPFQDRLDLTRVTLIGHSAGGHLALWAAGRGALQRGPGVAPRIRPGLVVGLAAVCDLFEAARRRLSNNAVVDLMGGPPETHRSAYQHASPPSLLPFGVRQLLFHGTADDSVPFEISERYRAAAGAAGDDCELVRLQDVDHFALIDPTSEVWDLIVTRSFDHRY